MAGRTGQKEKSFPPYDPDIPYNDFLGCLAILQLLDIGRGQKDLIKTCAQVCVQWDWTDHFLSGHFKQARERLLHTALLSGVRFDNWTLFNSALQQMTRAKMELSSCIKAMAHRGQKVQQVASHVYNTGDQWRNVELFLRDAANKLQEWEIVRRLLSKNYVREAFDADLDTALKQKECDNIMFAIDNGASRERLNQVLVAALMSKVQWVVVKECIRRGVSVHEACVEARLSLNGRFGRSILQSAAAASQWEVVKSLVQHGARPDLGDCEGLTTLHWAVLKKEWDVATFLIPHCRHLAETVTLMAREDTLLHLLCKAGRVDILQTLLEMGADPLVQNDRGETLLMVSIFAQTDRHKVILVLVQYGVSTHQAVLTNRLLQKPGITVHDLLLVSPMAVAVWSGMVRTVRALFKAGASLHREMFILERDHNVRNRLEQNDCDELLAFLQKVSSKPRKLRDLCALMVSHLIGCRPGREVRAERAGLPPPVCSHVLMHRVTTKFASNEGVDPAAE